MCWMNDGMGWILVVGGWLADTDSALGHHPGAASCTVRATVLYCASYQHSIARYWGRIGFVI